MKKCILIRHVIQHRLLEKDQIICCGRTTRNINQEQKTSEEKLEWTDAPSFLCKVPSA